MATVYGSIGPFDSKDEDWTSYAERMKQYFLANEIVEDVRKKGIFISSCGPQTYQLLKSLVAPEKPKDKPFTDIIQALQNHYQPKPSKIIQTEIPFSLQETKRK
jgi:ABC-type dipeptide/oligopeptide/nickel transport system ATPase component